jgi:iron complex transport system substrate-binding protein
MFSCYGRSFTGAYLSLLVLALAPAVAPAQADLPTVASINLCTDQLVLSVADPEQILSLSWLASDPEESMLAEAASRYPQNHGSAEELIALGADVVIAGAETSPFARALLARLGATVIEVAPETSLADVHRNLRQVGDAIDRSAAAEAVVATMQTRAAALRARRPAAPQSAIVVRPGGFTVGRDTLANELLELAGLENAIAELDRWGSLSIETLLTARPEFVVITRYRSAEASLANSVFAHPALVSLHGRQRTLEVEERYFACGAPANLTVAEALSAQMAAL